MKNDFNPRSHEGSDTVKKSNEEIAKISILAPTRGATEEQEDDVKDDAFQSSLPRGERHKLSKR